MNRKGFTLIELILVIAILGILAVSALPKFLNLTGEARRASRDGVVGAVRSGIALYRANSMATGGAGTFPTELGSQGDGAACTICFSQILISPLADSQWQRTNITTYTYNDGAAVTTYTYNSTNGTFQ